MQHHRQEINMKQELSYTELLDRVQMHAADRVAAQAALMRAEAIASAVYRAMLAVQAAVQWIGRSAQRLRARFA
jgi:hypothetical protein